MVTCFGIRLLSLSALASQLLNVLLYWTFLEPRETGTNFSITVTQDVTVEAGRCIPISCKFTYPGNITEYVRRVWFKGDALTPVFEKDAEVCGVVWQSLRGPERSCSFFLEDQQEGESEYRFKLTWGGDQMYVFPERVRVSVSGT